MKIKISAGQDTINTLESKDEIMAENFLHEIAKAAGLASATEAEALLEELGIKLGR